MQEQLKELIARLAHRDARRSEATIQADVRQLLLAADLNLREDNLLDVNLEAPVGDRRRIDVEVGATVIEVKRDLRTGNVRCDAVTQLQGYVRSRQEKVGGRYVGILTDGAEWRCYHLGRKNLAEVSSVTVIPGRTDTDTLLVWLEGVLATARDLKPTPEAIASRLGAKSSSHALDNATLAALYGEHKDLPAIRTKRHLWARLLQTALGTQFDDSDELFIEHTLLVNSAEIIAHAVLGLDVQSLPPASLLAGAKFDESGISGVVEADFFDWVVDAPEGEAFVRTLARRLDRFEWSAVEHDVLKVLYESVITTETRKKLGEYYTPDWLAEKVVEAVVPDPLDTRVLDPSCGSGTFLFHAVRRYLDAAKAKGTSLADMLAGVTNHVFGIDLHPVAVTLARVTYVLAIGRDRLAGRRDSIQIPVYLGDSMQWRQKSPNLFTNNEFTMLVDDQRALLPSEFRFPNDLLADAHTFDDLVKELAAKASAPGRSPKDKLPSLEGLLRRLAIPPTAHAAITSTFATMCRLHDEGRDHIWGYYIRNLARPGWLACPQNRVDALIGNPPWLAYRFMPAEMQSDFRAISRERNLWQGDTVATQQDLSGLFVVRAIQLYLKDQGRFGFVMPGAALDRGQFTGFRTGDFGGQNGNLCVTFSRPWDLRRLRPHLFLISASVVFGARTERAGPLCRPFELWSGRAPKDANASWNEASTNIRRSAANQAALPTGKGSQYGARFANGASIFPRLFFMVDKVEAGPLGQVKGKAKVCSARSATEKKPWRHLPNLEGVVETEFLRPVHLGETVLPYRVLPARLAVIPRDMTELLDETSPHLDRYPGLAGWWRHAATCWMKNRSSDKLTLLQRLNYHNSLEGQFSIRPQRVVYSKSGMHLAAARLADRRAVIDHSLYWATAASTEEAHYLCAVLNSVAVTELVRPLMSYGKDERHFDKHIWKLPIPLFDPNVKPHARLAELGATVEAEIAELPLDLDKHFAVSRRAIREFLETSEAGRQVERLVPTILK